MTFNTIGIIAGHAEHERQKKAKEEEEERLTPYSAKELSEDWEFKILRTQMGGFRDPARLRAILDEEKRGGWMLVEKFDDERIRLKRRAGTKLIPGDFADSYDPYRTLVQAGMNPQARFVVFSVVAILIVAFFAFLGWQSK
jgi:hypothetical protein